MGGVTMVGKIQSSTPWYVLNAPELGGAFFRMERLYRQNGVLDVKTDALIRLALAVTRQNRDDIEAAIQDTLKLGASREEVTEVLLLSVVQKAQTNLSMLDDIGTKYLMASK